MKFNPEQALYESIWVLMGTRHGARIIDKMMCEHKSDLYKMLSYWAECKYEFEIVDVVTWCDKEWNNDILPPDEVLQFWAYMALLTREIRFGCEMPAFFNDIKAHLACACHEYDIPGLDTPIVIR